MSEFYANTSSVPTPAEQANVTHTEQPVSHPQNVELQMTDPAGILMILGGVALVGLLNKLGSRQPKKQI